MLKQAVTWTQINSGEYLDLSGKRGLLMAEGTDILNVHAQVSDVMRIGWLAADLGVPVCLGNTFLEMGVHMAVALPEVGGMKPVRIFMVVDLPAPLGPRKPTILPSGMVKEIASMATRSR